MVAFVAGLIFVACSDSDSADDPLQPAADQTSKAECEMGFSCRFAEPTTRAAGDGEYTTEMLQASGFGVYCWYTGSTHFDPAFTAPNTHIKDYLGENGQLLMNNQKVVWDGTRSIWTYTPKKYWPINRDELLTLRAYAPYTSYVMTDVHGMPQLPVVLGTATKNARLYGNDYHEGTQHDPLWGTGRLVLPGGEYDRDAGHEKYGSLYDNITYEMSGNNRLKETTPADTRNGTIDWFFHHGMSCLMFTCSVIADPGCDKVVIRSIEINDLYTRGLLSLSSPTATESEKPVWNQRDGNMRVRLSNADKADPSEADSTDLASKPFEINTKLTPPRETDPVNLLSHGLLIIPREFATGEGMKVIVTYTIDNDSELKIAVGTIKRNFDGNTKYTLGLKLTPATKGLEIEVVQSAFTPWYDGGTGESDVYNW
jgi:hypothetical protein